MCYLLLPFPLDHEYFLSLQQNISFLVTKFTSVFVFTSVHVTGGSTTPSQQFRHLYKMRDGPSASQCCSLSRRGSRARQSSTHESQHGVLVCTHYRIRGKLLPSPIHLSHLSHSDPRQLPCATKATLTGENALASSPPTLDSSVPKRSWLKLDQLGIPSKDP